MLTVVGRCSKIPARRSRLLDPAKMSGVVMRISEEEEDDEEEEEADIAGLLARSRDEVPGCNQLTIRQWRRVNRFLNGPKD